MPDMTQQTFTAGPLFDKVQTEFKIKNDAALARHLRVPPSVISKMRNGVAPLTPSVIIRLHELTDMPVKAIKFHAGLPRFDLR